LKNRIDPELRESLELFPALDLDNLEETRKLLAESQEALDIPLDETISLTEKMVPGAEGEPDVRVRIHEPKERSGVLQGLLWIHGGGYVLGTAKESDLLCQQFVKEAGCVVVSVDYRLAPEHPYPAPLEDCYAALKWFSENAAELGVDPERIGAAGQSAGGGLTAGLALLARDRQGPKLAFQMPLYPMIDDRNNSPSCGETGSGHLIWNQELNEKGWQAYLDGMQGTENVPEYAAPARAEDLSGLPYTYTCIGQLDPFRDETLTYVTRLAQAGVDVEFHLYPGAYHGFEGLAPQADVAQRALSDYVRAAKWAMHREAATVRK
jgi:acetyl esterase/lipase